VPAPVSDEDNTELFSPVRGDDESPPQGQPRELFAKSNCFPSQECTPASENSEPSSASSSSVFDVPQFLPAEAKEIEDIIACSVAVFSEKQRACPHHLSLSLFNLTSPRVDVRQLLLRCSNFWKKGSEGKPLCSF
jgi:hypothetical protein